jgi:hypothetical protein
MFDRLVVHAHVPKSGSGLLNRNVFLRSFTRGETMLVYGHDHGQLARLAGINCAQVAARISRTRLAIGHVPYGYFDGFGRWTIYVSVFDDPVRRFLGFVGSVIANRNATAEALFGPEAAAASAPDLDHMIDELLALEDVQLRQTDMMTRIAAGLPVFQAEKPQAGHLDAACANIGRSNYLVATRDQIPTFESYLIEVLGVPVGGRGTGGWDNVMPVCSKPRSAEILRADIGGRTLRRIEAANALDMRLYDAVIRQNAVCWA